MYSCILHSNPTVHHVREHQGAGRHSPVVRQGGHTRKSGCCSAKRRTEKQQTRTKERARSSHVACLLHRDVSSNACSNSKDKDTGYVPMLLGMSHSSHCPVRYAGRLARYHLPSSLIHSPLQHTDPPSSSTGVPSLPRAVRQPRCCLEGPILMIFRVHPALPRDRRWLCRHGW